MKIDEEVQIRVRKIFNRVENIDNCKEVLDELEYEFQKELQREKNKCLKLTRFLEEIGFDIGNKTTKINQNLACIKKDLKQLEDWGDFLSTFGMINSQ